MSHSNLTYPEQVYRLLAAPRRRYLLWYLSRRGSTTVEEAAARIAAWEASARPGEVAREACEHIRISLVHAHLPRLADHDVVDYDRASGEVELQTEVSGWFRSDDSLAALDADDLPADLDVEDVIDRS